MLMPTAGRLPGSGRTADVHEFCEARVLRRDREGGADAVAEAAVTAHVRTHGCPAPAVRPPVSRADLVRERLDGPTTLQAFTAGTLEAGERELIAPAAESVRSSTV
ncbi:hypothetical protein [Streptomyces sp. AK04-3B]|uniref:hypothetical protein n=1 Tax=Streptomyces sp. AK04-3B TaxID=3028650 RepID=UPI0029BB128A|nr:hypothetical protein [Streptomyces sp. AK04-3B]MDX3804072.1 hypothetical protein [Streptomyces sp. AK04-3B]